MKLIKPNFEIIEQEKGLDGVYKQVELAGRTCYKSEDRISEGSAKKFVDMMIKSGHGAMLEHGTVYLYFPMLSNENHLYHKAEEYYKNPYSKVKIAFEENGQPIHANNGYYITTNLRVLVENGWLDDLKYICEPTEYHEKRVTVKFTCDRGVSHEFVRHRVFSFAQESTRYCNYSRDKFCNELTFIEPCWTMNHHFVHCLELSEEYYLYLLEKGWKPQQARQVLPNALKTELVMTGFVSDWKHFFELRCDSHAHPQAQELAIPLREEFTKRGYIGENEK